MKDNFLLPSNRLEKDIEKFRIFRINKKQHPL